MHCTNTVGIMGPYPLNGPFKIGCVIQRRSSPEGQHADEIDCLMKILLGGY